MQDSSARCSGEEGNKLLPCRLHGKSNTIYKELQAIKKKNKVKVKAADFHLSHE